MEANDAADTIREAADEREREADEQKLATQARVDRFKRQAAIVIGILAMLLAITALGGDQARTTTTNENIRASDAYAFYQAKNIRQTVYLASVGALQALVAAGSPLSPAAQTSIKKTITRYTATAAHLEDDPTGAGKKQLLAQARRHEEERDRAERQDHNFNYAQALFQIAIVLGSVSIVASSRAILGISSALGVLAALLMLNGYVLFPFVPLSR